MASRTMELVVHPELLFFGESIYHAHLESRGTHKNFLIFFPGDNLITLRDCSS